MGVLYLENMVLLQNLIDLAGNEKAKQAKTAGNTLADGRYNNTSLSTLSRVINQLSSKASSVFTSYTLLLNVISL